MDMEASSLSPIELLELKIKIGELGKQFLVSKTGLQNLVKTYEQPGVEEPAKQESIKQAVDHLDRSLEEGIHASLAEIDARLAQVSAPALAELESKIVEASSPPRENESTGVEASRTPSPWKNEKKIEEAPKTPSPMGEDESKGVEASRTPSPLEVNKDKIEDSSRTPSPMSLAEEEPSPRITSPVEEEIISLTGSHLEEFTKELEAAKPKTEKEQRAVAQQADRAFETLNLGGKGMKEILKGLSLHEVYCLRCYVFSYWKHRIYKHPLMSVQDSRVKALAPLRLAG